MSLSSYFYWRNADPLTVAETSGHVDLKRLIWLRGIAIIGFSFAAGVAGPLFHVVIPIVPLSALIGLWIAINVVSVLRLGRIAAVSKDELLVHLIVDVAMLTALLAVTGGPANPLTSLYLPPVAVAAALLPSRQAWFVAVLGVVGYSMLWELSVPLTVEDVDRAETMHLTGMWLTFAASALLITGFLTRMTMALQERERQLAAAREQSLRDERIVELGNLAAGAAHELGTPLATMSVIAGELIDDPAMPESLKGDLVLLSEQIAACKAIITGLAERAGVDRAEGGAAVPIDRWIEAIVERWRSLRPQVTPRLSFEDGCEAPQIVADATLEQALTILFNNAADASPNAVEIVCRCHGEDLQLDVLDRGPGFPEALRARVGREFLSTREEGAGIGLFLAHATLERYGGDICIEQRADGGTCARVNLPLANLRVREP